MSVIAWDGKNLAADRQGSDRGFPRAHSKVCPIKKRSKIVCIVAVCGAEDHFLPLVKWVEDGRKTNDYPKFQFSNDYNSWLVVVARDGVGYYSSQPYMTILEEKFMAWGSGRDLAMGAMSMGANAGQAVMIASKWNVYCGLGVDQFTLDEK